MFLGREKSVSKLVLALASLNKHFDVRGNPVRVAVFHEDLTPKSMESLQAAVLFPIEFHKV